ncbi:cobalamin-dependent protein [Pseudomonas putida]|uniref:methylmalonyl-CoA mutase family protein n=1 Tax=Pseudomonas putida TaxID=303 RepID=UPI0018AA07D1|nr:methylmalonyl-CoA mutase family protein [Pseudomonas putida]MBF8668233.1 cobalamin-dependent protein [Pseudomonas putida]MBF8711733.1 cobalamin-dependent protein [Pseudomonas putida]
MSRATLWRNPALRLKPLYQASDLARLPHLHSLPGQPPFLRGPYAGMYTQRPWTIRQYSGFADPQQSNLRLRQQLANGAQGLSIAFDLPTHRGYDSDDATCAADVGMAGVAIDSVEDMHSLFEGIALDQVSVSMTINGAALAVMAAFIVAAQERGIEPARLRGTLQNDILKEFMVRNTYVFAPAPSLRICTDIIEYLAEHLPLFNPISVSGYHFEQAGADPVLELALTLLNARTYLRQVAARGLDVNAFSKRMSFFFAVGSDLFTEVAKLRAARLLWCEISEAAGVSQAGARALRMHCQTSGASLSAQAPLNNLVRTTLQALSAVFGGTQSLHTNSWDEALALPSAEAAALACDTQRILQEESGVCDVIDPWAGSYMMESLTAAVCEQVRGCIAEIDASGGVLAALHNGDIGMRIHRQALAAQARLDRGEHARVGEGPSDGNLTRPPIAAPVDSQAVGERQRDKLRQLRARRDPTRVREHLLALEQGARDEHANLLALCIAAIAARATLGECTAALERVWPRHQQPARFCRNDYGALRARCPDWQAVLGRVQAFSDQRGRSPHVLLAKLGQDGHDRGIRLIGALLSDAGFEVTLLPLFQTPQQLQACLATAPGVDALGISSLAGAHNALLAQLMGLLRPGAPQLPVVLGGIIPQADLAGLAALGVAAVFGPGATASEIVERLLALITASRPLGE